ncbi:hypothetical protein roselon_00800 [Roseibacterium elongatum DSM 19469]|uniref:Cytochrome c domain-containing protein n=1 Tax=Roseicyclus elongatus DSM 19469 TaxID=1294273 RepID=W8S376_9RHOB|nr:cytochrome c [Roseibacterium elongatum]AHM03216.1 hypothetical protein roselon_00800 [Roseibacterium elongatum DSM 19469]
MRTTRAALAALLVLIPAPLVAVEDHLQTGETLFQRHCRACHGPDARRGASGDIRGLGEGTLRMALGGIESMPEFDFDDAEVGALVAYLARLAEAD